jgi:hypothetical protein
VVVSEAVDVIALPSGLGMLLIAGSDTLFIGAAGTPSTGCAGVLLMGFTIAAAMS